MNSKLRAILIGIALSASVQQAGADDTPPAIRVFDIATTEKLGRAMYDQDQLALHALHGEAVQQCAEVSPRVRAAVAHGDEQEAHQDVPAGGSTSRSRNREAQRTLRAQR